MTEQQHITDINITINSMTTTHDEGVHPSWAMSTWSSFQCIGPLYYAPKCEYISLQCLESFETYSNRSRMPKNSYVASFYSRFSKTPIKLLFSQVWLLFALQTPQNMAPNPQFHP